MPITVESYQTLRAGAKKLSHMNDIQHLLVAPVHDAKVCKCSRPWLPDRTTYGHTAIAPWAPHEQYGMIVTLRAWVRGFLWGSA